MPDLKMTTPFRAACLQMNSGSELAANLQQLKQMVIEAAGNGAQFVLSPEYCLMMDGSGRVMREGALPADGGSVLPELQALAEQLKIWLLAGSLTLKSDDDRIVNRSCLIAADGRIAATYDKIHMFDVQLNAGNIYRESDSYAAGAGAVVASLPTAKLGMTVCYDVRFPELFRQLAMAGAQIIAVPAAFTRITGEAHWHVLLRARAIETGSFILAAAQGGRHESGRETYGHSLIVSPWGEVLAEAGTEPGIVIADIDMAQSDLARARIPALAHDRAMSLTVLKPV